MDSLFEDCSEGAVHGAEAACMGQPGLQGTEAAFPSSSPNSCAGPAQHHSPQPSSQGCDTEMPRFPGSTITTEIWQDAHAAQSQGHASTDSIQSEYACVHLPLPEGARHLSRVLSSSPAHLQHPGRAAPYAGDGVHPLGSPAHIRHPMGLSTNAMHMPLSVSPRDLMRGVTLDTADPLMQRQERLTASPRPGQEALHHPPAQHMQSGLPMHTAHSMPVPNFTSGVPRHSPRGAGAQLAASHPLGPGPGLHASDSCPLGPPLPMPGSRSPLHAPPPQAAALRPAPSAPLPQQLMDLHPHAGGLSSRHTAPMQRGAAGVTVPEEGMMVAREYYDLFTSDRAPVPLPQIIVQDITKDLMDDYRALQAMRKRQARLREEAAVRAGHQQGNPSSHWHSPAGKIHTHSPSGHLPRMPPLSQPPHLSQPSQLPQLPPGPVEQGANPLLGDPMARVHSMPVLSGSPGHGHPGHMLQQHTHGLDLHHQGAHCIDSQMAHGAMGWQGGSSGPAAPYQLHGSRRYPHKEPANVTAHVYDTQHMQDMHSYGLHGSMQMEYEAGDCQQHMHMTKHHSMPPGLLDAAGTMPIAGHTIECGGSVGQGLVLC